MLTLLNMECFLLFIFFAGFLLKIRVSSVVVSAKLKTFNKTWKKYKLLILNIMILVLPVMESSLKEGTHDSSSLDWCICLISSIIFSDI